MSESVAEALSQRAALETRIGKQVEPVVRHFFTEILALASVALGTFIAGERLFPPTFSSATAATLWQTELAKLKKAGVANEVVERLAASDIPETVAAAVNGVYAEATSGMWSAETANRSLKRTLGLAEGKASRKDGVPSGTLGTLRLRDGGQLSWKSYVEQVSRTAATRSFAEQVIAELAAEGYPYKRWSTRHDDRVRETHVHADRQTVLLEESFQVGGEMLRYPGDELGSPALIDNCRCVIVGVKFAEDGLGPDWEDEDMVNPGDLVLVASQE